MGKLHIKKNDTVVVLAGEDKGKTGKVLKVLVEKNRALVEGVNMVSKSTKPSAKNLRVVSLSRKLRFTSLTSALLTRRVARLLA